MKTDGAGSATSVSFSSLRGQVTGSGTSGGVMSLSSTKSHKAWRTDGRRQKRVTTATNAASTVARAALLSARYRRDGMTAPLSAAYCGDDVVCSVLVKDLV